MKDRLPGGTPGRVSGERPRPLSRLTVPGRTRDRDRVAKASKVGKAARSRTAEGPAPFSTGYLAHRQEALDWLIR
jgi:hypothetical protein